MIKQLEKIEKQALAEINKAGDAQTLEELRIKYLGRKGIVSAIMGKISEIPPEQKPAFGKKANMLKNFIANKISEKTQSLAGKVKEKKEKLFDVTLPGAPVKYGKVHPVIQTLNRMKEIFIRLGFSIHYGPEVENEYYNFEALNIPATHPARDPVDNFYITEKLLLRSQTSPVQVRVMEKMTPPLRVICPGRVYRPDTPDASHSPMFHQLEGFMVDTDVTMDDLKTVLTLFAKEFFHKDVKMRFRPSFFPFTEPSAEIDISCIICGGVGCSVCSHKGWLEVGGCGMIDPNVFAMVNYDPEAYTGFAFGLGVERPAILKYGIDDIRLLFENDVRFLSQF